MVLTAAVTGPIVDLLVNRAVIGRSPVQWLLASRRRHELTHKTPETIGPRRDKTFPNKLGRDEVVDSHAEESSARRPAAPGWELLEGCTKKGKLGTPTSEMTHT